MSNDKSKFYDNDPNRKVADKSRYEGGNNSSTTKTNVEKHGSSRATRIAQGGSTGSGKTFGLGRSSGGNSSNGEAGGFEKHGSDRKTIGAEFVSHNNGRGGAKHSLIPSHVQIDDRGMDSSGNSSKGGQEPAGKAKRATRLDMSVERFHR